MSTGPPDGLLEQSSLLVRPRPLHLPLPHTQELADPAGRPVGVAFWRTTARPGRPRWLAWLSRPVVAVHETGEDQPLVCTARRLWSLVSFWEVRDADAHVIGVLYGPLVQDSFGRTQARRAPGPLRYLDPAGHELLTSSPSPEGLTLTFTPAAGKNPFQRMLLLCAALTAAPR